METTGKIINFSKDYKTNKVLVTLMLDTENIEEIENISILDKLSIIIKKFFKKRSLDANAYCWVLCDKIAKELSKEGTVITKENIYQDGILQIGTFEPMIIEERAFENFKRIWGKQGLGFLIQEVSRKNKCIKVHCYYGSSTYDSKEMSLLINLLVELAKSLNIETKTDKEIKSLLEQWH